MPAPTYIREETKNTKVPIATAKTVSYGNLVGLSSGTLVNAADTTWNTDLGTTQSDFRALFIGVSMQDKSSTTNATIYGNGTANVCMVATAGVYEYDCDSASFNVGDFVGPAKDTGNALLNNKVVAVATEARAIGRVAEAVTSGTRVRVKILSVLQPEARQS